MTTEDLVRFHKEGILAPFASQQGDLPISHTPSAKSGNWILSATMPNGETQELVEENGATKTFQNLSDVLDYLHSIGIYYTMAPYGGERVYYIRDEFGFISR